MTKDKAGIVMGEFKRGKLKSGSGGKVKNRKQAIAIALSEQRKQGGRMPSYYDSKSSKPKKTKVKKYQGGGPLVRPRVNVLGTGAAAAHQRAQAGGTHASELARQQGPMSQRTRSTGGGRGVRSGGPGFAGGGSINQLIDKKYKHGGRIPHNPSDVNP
jgi:hypothetical protein